MAADKPPPTLADYVVTAISPVLVMALVGSLVFFLAEVAYAGKYSERLLYTLFFFVFGAVLVARIAIEADAARAGVYGLGLGVATFIALLAYVEFPPDSPVKHFAWLINLALMGVIWWSANKLTWDCTFIDENRKSSGAGLLSAAGFDENAEPQPKRKPRPEEREPDEADEAAAGFWERYTRGLTRKNRKPHTPGVWVVYFSLAALPLFGLGQALIPAADEGRRRYVFWLMVIYVGSGLALLVTTSFLGLRRYLRQRNLQMPPAMAGVWLTAGAVLIAVFLLLGALLPRPNAEVALVEFKPFGSSDRKASKNAMIRDRSAGKGEGAEGRLSKVDKSGRDANNVKGPPGKAAGKGKSGNNPDSKSKGDKSGRDGDKGGKNAEKGEAGNSRDENKDEARDGPTDREADDAGDQESKDGSGNDGSSSPNSPKLAGLEKVANVLKWIVFIVVALVFLYFVIRHLSQFSAWAKGLLAALQALWARLFGGGTAAAGVAEEGPAPGAVVRPRPFSSFSNPFLGGSRQSPEELVRYSFNALNAWAWEHDQGRRADETPLEFAARIGDEFPAVEEAARRLSGFYARMTYGVGNLPSAAVAAAREFWDLADTLPTPAPVVSG